MILPTDFVVGTITLDWADILWAYKRSLIGWRAPIELAKLRTTTITSDPLELALAAIDKDQDWRVGEIVDELAARGRVPEEVSNKKWLYLTLLWLYETQKETEVLFKSIELVYADFDYPDEISGFVPYMPPTDGFDPRTHTREECVARLLDKLCAYLDSSRRSYTADR